VQVSGSSPRGGFEVSAGRCQARQDHVAYERLDGWFVSPRRRIGGEASTVRGRQGLRAFHEAWTPRGRPCERAGEPRSRAEGICAPNRAVHARAGRPQGRRRRQRRHPRVDPTDGRRRRSRTPVPAGQGGPALRPGRLLRPQPPTTTRANASSPGTTWCRPRATSSSAGPTSVGRTRSSATTTCGNCGTGNSRYRSRHSPRGMTLYARLCG